MLSNGKAKGVDELEDKMFKDPEIWEMIRHKTLSFFNNCLAEAKVPTYFKKARVVPLSKDPNGSQFPKYGEVRTIAVTPAIAKLYELCLL
jgi:hypothetical protein